MKQKLFGFVFTTLSLTAGAQTALHYGANERVDPDVVARILSAPAGKMRSLRLLDAPAPAGAVVASAAAAAEAAKTTAETPSALSIPVQFAFDSADILPAARPQLDAIAIGIKQLPAAQAVTIEGHTDAKGADRYNLVLSERRARAVKEYLVRVHGIEEKRLATVGLGKYRPIEGLDPLAAENRRVQFRGSAS